ncbi:MAG: flagellar hook-associated protein FlgK [Rickettsiales bacterium]
MTNAGSLGLALNNAVSGLRVNQQSLAVLSQNIANVNTEGYSRQVVQQSANYIAGVGSGVNIDDITRKIDVYLQRSSISQGSTTASSQTVSSYYDRLQSLIGQPGASNSIDEYITTFFNSLQQLANNPDTLANRSNTVNGANILAQQISGLAYNIQDLRLQADNDITAAVRTVNQTIDQLSNINDAIATAKGVGNSTAGLLDQRDQLLKTLSENFDITVNYEDSGRVNVTTGSGAALVEGGIRHQLQYIPAQSSNAFIQGTNLNALTVLTLNTKNEQIGTPVTLIGTGQSENVTSRLTSGKLNGLQQLRDNILPQVLSQLDELANGLRNSVNAIQNAGSGYPPANSLTGERALDPTAPINFSGVVRIATVNNNGSPLTSFYADENYTGIRPLNLDLGALNSGSGQGAPSTQAIIDEINDHFKAPGPKVKLGDLNNIRLASDTAILPSGAPSLFNFDLDIENISSSLAPVFVTGVTVLNSVGTNITSLTQNAPNVTLSTSNTYTTTAGLSTVDVNLQTLPAGLAVGDTIYLGAPSAPSINGIPAANLTGYFTVSAITGNSVTIDSGVIAGVGPAVSDATPATAYGAYAKVVGGQQIRTSNSQFQVDLTAGAGSPYYDITLDVGTVDSTGAVRTSQITYRVNNNTSNLYNDRYTATAANGNGTIVLPQTTQDALRAILVDADGNELPKFNGVYGNQPGYLKLIAADGAGVAIDSLDSSQNGLTNVVGDIGTGYGFSQYFGLNNFFESNGPTATGDTLHNSAINLKVQDRLLNNANLVSTGSLTLQKQPPAGSTLPPQYTYLRYAGDNTIAQKLAQLSTAGVSFQAAGGLASSTISIGSYSSQILSFQASQASASTAEADNAKTLLDGFTTKQNATSGVNLDEELANTITYQNAYAATARVITIVNQLYDSLLQAIQ